MNSIKIIDELKFTNSSEQNSTAKAEKTMILFKLIIRDFYIC